MQPFGHADAHALHPVQSNRDAKEIPFILDRIHEALLHFVEHHDPESQQQAHKYKTINQPSPADEFTATEETILECLNNWSHGVKTHESVYRHSHEKLAPGLT